MFDILLMPSKFLYSRGMSRKSPSGGGTNRDLREEGLRLATSRLPATSTVTIVRPLAGGHTEAEVLLCDIGASPGDDSAIDGQFVLKAGYSSGRLQAEAHNAFTGGLPAFAATHVPGLVFSAQDAGTSIDIYDVAGFSLDSARTAEHLDIEDREEVCARTARDLLAAQLNAAGQPIYGQTIGAVVQQWLGADFPNNQRGSRIRRILHHFPNSEHSFQYEGELLPNPLALLSSEYGLTDKPLPCFHGPTHGDLHLRNILARGSRQTRDLDYWLIDVNWENPAPLFYDHAYLELSAFLFGINSAATGRVLPLLARLDDEVLTVPVDLDLSDTALVRLLQRTRNETLAVLEEKEPKRADVWRRQFLYARVAAGLNWAAKPLDDPVLRRAAFLSACWAARLLVRRYHQPIWVDLAGRAQVNVVGVATGADPITAVEALRRWAPFHEADNGMDLFLIADSVEAKKEFAVLGHGKWATVIDLDPDSDVSGLSSVMLDELQQLRHVSVFGRNQQPVTSGVATNWFMANGWTSHDEPTTGSDEEWRRQRFLYRVRQMIDGIYDGTPNQRVGVLCLRSRQRDRQLDHVIDYIDEVYGGIELRLDLAQTPAVNGTDLDAFLSVIAESLPAVRTVSSPSLPGLERPWTLTQTDLHRLAVDLDVLHSEVLSHSQSMAIQPTDEFWRGRPPTWSELEAWLDVQRDACPELLRDIRDRLNNHQLVVVSLDHSPGAGGTTLARRVAWNLHRSFPTAVLHSYSSNTAERIDEIYQETGYPALVVSESTILPESDREELVQELVRRNSRAVLLWVNRTNIDRGTKHKLIDPLKGPERAQFIQEYRRRAETRQAQRLLDDLAMDGDETVPASKLSPFYFGLCVYDSEFEGVVPYVRNHLQNLTTAQKELARHLALITRYGQNLGLPVHLVRAWLGEDSPRFTSYGDAELRELLGPDLRHLVVVEYSSLRLLHPLIAEQVIKGEPGSKQYGLGQISVEFIRRVTGFLGAQNYTTSRLLSELFIRRTSWAPNGQKSLNFSELIQDMSVEAGELVFKELTERCPDNAHFWNHRGRFHIYKVRGDFKRAEEYLLMAVEKAKGLDSTHLHTLGLVRRFWIENILDNVSRKDKTSSPEELLEHVEPLFDKAMQAFSDAGKYQDSEHIWATPIQLIATVIERIWQASGSDSLADFMERDTATARWVTKQIAVAEQLLDNLHSLSTPGRYYRKLNQQLDLLYGDVERLVEQWKLLRDNRESPEVDLAIARTLYATAGRNWALLAEDQVRTIAEMAAGPVYSGLATDADLRLWLQSYRRLPEYSETQALERLNWFAVEKDSLDANYYLYILHFLIWYRGDARDQNRIRYYLEECRRLSRQERRQWSFEWLGVETRSHPLVHFSELGKQRHGPTNFWSRPHELMRVSGIIEEIKSPQSGRLRVTNGQLSAFFTPRNRFRQTRDVNATVEFYLGFSYEGLRAWEPTYPDERPEALDFAELPAAAQPERAVTVPVIVDEDDSVDTPEPPDVVVPPQPKPARPKIDPRLLRTLSDRHQEQTGTGDDFKSVIVTLLNAAHANGRELSSLELGSSLQQIFGVNGYDRFRAEHGDGKLGKALNALGFRTKPTRSGFDVDLH